MSFSLSIDHQPRLVAARAIGEVTIQYLQNLLAEIISAQAMPYRKLFDVSAARVVDVAKLEEAAATVRLYAAKGFGPVGPVAVVVASGVESPAARLFVASAPAERPVMFFEDVTAAQSWLETLV